MKKSWLAFTIAGLIVSGAAVASAQPGTPVDPMERAIGHLERARAALTEESVRTNPQVQMAYEELAKALDAVRQAKELAPSPGGRTPGATAEPFPFADPFTMGFGRDGSMPGGDPFADMRRMREEMNEMMRRAFADPGMAPGFAAPGLGSLSPGMSGPAADMDIKEEQDRYVVTMDLPGVGKDDIRIEARENHLQISGTREEAIEESNEHDGFLRRERRIGSFSRVVPLPGPIDPGKMEATHENGILKITAPKKGAAEQQSRIVIVK